MKQKLGDKLRQKREVINSMIHKENVAQTKHSRSARADYLKTSETVRLAFSEFVLVVLLYQLTKHEEFLNGFLNLFTSVDEDGDGVVSEPQFIALIEKMQIGLEEEQM